MSDERDLLQRVFSEGREMGDTLMHGKGVFINESTIFLIREFLMSGKPARSIELSSEEAWMLVSALCVYEARHQIMGEKPSPKIAELREKVGKLR